MKKKVLYKSASASQIRRNKKKKTKGAPKRLKYYVLMSAYFHIQVDLDIKKKKNIIRGTTSF